MRAETPTWEPNREVGPIGIMGLYQFHGGVMKLPEFDSRPQPGDALYSAPDDGEDGKMVANIVIGVACLVALFVFGFGGLVDIAVSVLRAILN